MHRYLPNGKETGLLLLITAGHLILANWALKLVSPELGVSLMWLPDGYLLAMLVIVERRLWPVLIASVFAFTGFFEFVVTERPLGLVGLFGIANLFESVVGALIFIRFCGGKEGFQNFLHLSYFILLCVLLIPTVSASLGAYAVVTYGFNDEFLKVYRVWHSSAGLGILFVAPLIIENAAWYRHREIKLSRKSLLIALTMLSVVLLVLVSSMVNGYTDIDGELIVYLTLPILCWSAIRFGLKGAVASSAALVVCSLHLTSIGLSPFSGESLNEARAVFQLQTYLGAAIIASFYTALAIDNLNESTSKLRESSAHLLAMFENSPIALWEEDFSRGKKVIDRLKEKGITNIPEYLADNPSVVAQMASLIEVIRVNDRTVAMFDSHSEPHLLSNIPLTFTEGSLDIFREEVVALYSGNKGFKAEAVVKRLTGEEFYIIVSVTLMPGCEDDWRRVIVSMEEITERKKAEVALQQAAAVYASTSEGVVITDLSGNITDINQAFEEITGYAPEDVINQPIQMIKSDEGDERFFKKMWLALLEHGSWRNEIQNRRKSGELYSELLAMSTVRDGDGNPINYVGVFSDISQLKETEEELKFLAHHDPLTNLPNRVLLRDRIEQAIKNARRDQNRLAIVFLDLDRFKLINDSFGHAAGDEILQQVAQRLQSSLRNKDSVARISGDEFVLLIEDVKQADSLVILIDRIFESFSATFNVTETKLKISASLGVSIYPDDGDNAETLLRNADAAMYDAKEDGRNTYHFYTKSLTDAAKEYISIENALHDALRNDEFSLVYQPQVDLASGRYIGVEALIRWHHPQRGHISPNEFIPIAEQTGLIVKIGSWVLQEVCRQGNQWLRDGVDFGRIAINIAGPQLQTSVFSQNVLDTLARNEFPPERLELEITERVVMRRIDASVVHMDRLQKHGVEISIDDFGTGYSSLSYLKRLPVDKLKIDKSFVADIPDDSDDMAIVETIIAMARALNLLAIAEGVETDAQAAFLAEKGCNQAQGFLYCKPCSPEAIAEMLAIPAN